MISTFLLLVFYLIIDMPNLTLVRGGVCRRHEDIMFFGNVLNGNEGIKLDVFLIGYDSSTLLRGFTKEILFPTNLGVEVWKNTIRGYTLP